MHKNQVPHNMQQTDVSKLIIELEIIEQANQPTIIETYLPTIIIYGTFVYLLYQRYYN